MKDYYMENSIKTRAAYCTEYGIVFVEDLVQKQVLYKIDIFGDRYKYLLYEWNIRPCFFFSPDEKWLIITYGMGYIYYVEMATGMICERIRLFDDVDYENNSFEDLDICCYYNEYTHIDFSASGRYMCARVRGDFDPQESDGREIMFNPVFFRSVFVFDMKTKEEVFKYTYPETEEYQAISLGTISFSPDENLFVTGVFGGLVKVFDLLSGKEIASLEQLEWVAEPCDIDNRHLVVFLSNNEFLYVNNDKELVWVVLEGFSNWYIKTKIVREEIASIRTLFDIEYDCINKVIKCYGWEKAPICIIELQDVNYDS